jgi:hypothetical protein
LGWIDWNWGPYIGAPAFPNIRVVGAAVSTARPPDGPGPELIERYTNKDNGRYFLSACFETAPGKPQNVRIISAGQQLYTGKIDGLVRTTPLGFTGPSVEIYYAAATPGGPRVMRRRIRILRTPDAAPALYAPTLKEVDE